MMRKYLEAVATVGTYKDRETGEEKKRRLNVGTLFRDDETGRLSLKLEAVPVGKDWSGWIDLFEPNGERQQRREQPPRQRQEQGHPQDRGGDDDIPF
jgi:hypothetical protein